MPNAPIPVRIVNGLTTLNEVGRVVDVLPVRATTDLVAVNEVGRPIDVPLATIEAGLIATNEVGGAVSVTPVRIVTDSFVPDAAGRLVFAPPLRGLAVGNPPVNTALPVITQTGSVLSVTTGTWTGTAPITYAYQVTRNGTPVGAPSASQNYTIPDADLNALFGCIVTATNSGGNASAAAALLYVGVMDVLSVQPAVNFELRRESRSYTGNAIRVRRSSDNAEANIGFTAIGDLDTTALLTFVGSGNGFITILYDKSGNGRNATQTTPDNQPRIVNAGVIETQNGKPVVRFDGTDILITPSFILGNTVVTVARRSATNQPVVEGANVATGDRGLWGLRAGSTDFTTHLNYGINGGALNAANADGFPINALQIVSQTAAKGTVATTASIWRIGGGTGGYVQLDGFISALISFPPVLSTAERQLIERNRAAYYGIPIT